jgi:phenolic acid decarboxylase
VTVTDELEDALNGTEGAEVNEHPVVHWRDLSGMVACGRWAYDSTRDLSRVTCPRCRKIAADPRR